MISGYDAYRIFQPLKLHFNTEYDFFTYKGKSPNISPKHYKEKNDRFYFEMVGQKHTKQEFFRFCVANFKHDKYITIQEILGMEAKIIFRRWEATLLSMEHDFKESVKSLLTTNEKWAIIVGSNNKTHPDLLRMTQSGMLTEESFLIYDTIFGLFNTWENNDLLYNNTKAELLNYKEFLNIDKSYFRTIFKNVLESHKT